MHLSDIHFLQRRSDRIYDLDQDLRNELERDAKAMRGRLGSVHGVLVTGDIAFAGRREEYDTALNWLKRLCSDPIGGQALDDLAAEEPRSAEHGYWFGIHRSSLLNIEA